MLAQEFSTQDTDYTLLDNPIWSSATSAHRALVRQTPHAAKYHRDISPFAALKSPNARSFRDLRNLVEANDPVGFITPMRIIPPKEWQTVDSVALLQMVCTAAIRSPDPEFVLLDQQDIPEMLALTDETKPGPFRSNTFQTGPYFGIRAEGGKLAAMAGNRLAAGRFLEISAVCTAPDFRGRGYGRKLVSYLAAKAQQQNLIPFLHVSSHNSARELYENIGFQVRRFMDYTIIQASE
jgi:predicted GNAT family acetyltransferase